MKNLSALYQSNYSHDYSEKNEQILKAIGDKTAIYCYDPDNGYLFMHCGTTLFKINSKLIDNNLGNSINIECYENFSESSGVCIWVEDGSIYSLDVLGTIKKIHDVNADNPVIELVEHLDNGPRCMEISPDREIFALVDQHWNVVTMMDLKILSKQQLEDCYIKNADETQEEKLSSKPSITWRGDGNFFAVSLFNNENNSRQFKVYNREGVSMYTSELSTGLEAFLSWKPSGNLIATSQRLPNKHVISLFEKNGLKHRELILPFEKDDIVIKKISWSPDSDILTIWADGGDKHGEFLQLWTENNYHWYLKQTINFTKDNPLIYFEWVDHVRVQKQLIIFMKNTFMSYTFRWCINHSRGIGDNDKSVVGVIDGNRVLLTGFKVGIVPPPMSHETITAEQTINECFFAPSLEDCPWPWLDSNAVFCQLSNGHLALYLHVNENLLKYKFVKTFSIDWEIKKIIPENILYTMHHFLWLKSDVILCSVAANSKSFLVVIEMRNFDVDVENLKSGSLVVTEVIGVEGDIHHIVASPDVNTAYLVVGDSVVKYTHNIEIEPTDVILPELCDQIEILNIENKHVVVTLGRRNGLCVDGRQVARNITSMSVHSEFLLLTTFQHALVCVKIDKEGLAKLLKSDLTVKSWETECPEGDIVLSMRRLERGSTLVMTIPRDSKTILQMPRGNLETIQPRSLSLHIIKHHLDSKNYYEAFDLMRKQRINLNLIYDHNPTHFVENSEKFVDDIKNPTWLNIFISELQDDDVTKTIYKTCYSETENNARETIVEVTDEGKVEKICKLLREIFEKKSTTRNLVQPILTCLVKNKHIQGLEGALRRIKEFGQTGKTTEEIKKKSEEALKYLLYLVEVNVLFDISLGMYDLDLAKCIAFMSQKDPKEFIPYLNSLAELEENARKFQIDKDLKRWESSLTHISKLPERFNECIDIISTHNLYLQALKIYKIGTKEYKEISRLAGEYYIKNKKYREAGMMFQRSDNLDRALFAYKLSGSWQDAIIVSTSMNLTLHEVNRIYEDLVNIMKNERRYKDAADICYTYLKQPEETVALLCEGKEWRDALRIAKFHNRPDLVETHVKPGVKEHADFLLNKINGYKNDFIKHQLRLEVVRKQKALRAAQDDLLNDDEQGGGGEMSDLLSETSFAGSTTSRASKASRSSGRTYKSSKNRRKQERKVLSIKTGSVFEDLALIRALYEILTNVYELRSEVVDVNKMLVNFIMDEVAEKLQSALEDMLSIGEKSKHRIWIKSDVSKEEEEVEDHVPHSLLETKYTFPPEMKSVNWKLDVL